MLSQNFEINLGFSLIELLIVIAIIGILLMVGIPSYNQYIIKARMVDFFAVAESHKIKLLENLINTSAISTRDDNYIVDYPSILVTRLERVINRQEQKYFIKMTANMDNLGIKLIENQPLVVEFIANEDHNNGLVTWDCQYNKEGYAAVMPKNCKQLG